MPSPRVPVQWDWALLLSLSITVSFPGGRVVIQRGHTSHPPIRGCAMGTSRKVPEQCLDGGRAAQPAEGSSGAVLAFVVLNFIFSNSPPTEADPPGSHDLSWAG